MALKILRLDEENSRIYFDVDSGVITTRTTRQMGSLIKQNLQFSPHIDLDSVFTWQGREEFATGDFTGLNITMQNGWTIWTEDQGAKHRFRITQGLILDSAGGDPMGTPTNIVWSVPEHSVSALLTAAAGASSGGSDRTLDKS